jgi:hypothetical protein
MELNELPGSELILPGLEDLYHGRNNTIGSLLISTVEATDEWWEQQHQYLTEQLPHRST